LGKKEEGNGLVPFIASISDANVRKREIMFQIPKRIVVY